MWRGRFFLRFTLALALVFLFGVVIIQPTRTQEEEELYQWTDEILQQVSKLSGLPVKAKVQVRFKERAELRRYILSKIEEEYSPSKLEGWRRSLVKFGFLPSETDLKELLLALYQEQVGGFYDPETKLLFLVKGFPKQLQGAIISHELTHALQDQHFDLLSLLKSNSTNDDLTLARQSVIEGVATGVMIEYLTGAELEELPELGPAMKSAVGLQVGFTPVFSSAPLYFQSHLLFPYLEGTAFYQKYLKRMKEQDLSHLFNHLPFSTEQVIHFEKYGEEEDIPVIIELNRLGDVLPSGWTLLYGDVMGELDVKLLLQSYLPEEEAREASQGWDGDSYRTYQREGEEGVILIWLSTWDTSGDAQEFYSSYQKLVREKYRHERMEQEQGNSSLWHTEEALVYLERRGEDVLVIEGVSKPLLSPIITAACSSEKVPVSVKVQPVTSAGR